MKRGVGSLSLIMWCLRHSWACRWTVRYLNLELWGELWPRPYSAVQRAGLGCSQTGRWEDLKLGMGQRKFSFLELSLVIGR